LLSGWIIAIYQQILADKASTRDWQQTNIVEELNWIGSVGKGVGGQIQEVSLPT